MNIRDEILHQLDKLIAEGDRLISSYKSDKGSYYSDLPEEEFRSFATTSLASINRIAGRESEYYLSVPQCNTTQRIAIAGFDSFVPALVGATKALRDAVQNDLLTTLEARLRAKIHDDLLVQANELLTKGYHVASMVLIGGVLENHMVKLTSARGLTWNGSGSLSKYNDLLRDVVYPQSVWRRIQAIGDARNDAAHGNGNKVMSRDVVDALQFVQRTLADYPQ